MSKTTFECDHPTSEKVVILKQLLMIMQMYVYPEKNYFTSIRSIDSDEQITFILAE